MAFDSTPGLIANVRTFLQEGSTAPTGTGTFTDGQLAKRLNMAYSGMLNEMQRNYRPELLAYQNMQVENTNTGLLDLPMPPDAGSLVCLTYRTTDVPSNEELTAVRAYRQVGVQQYAGWYAGFTYEQRENKFYILNNKPSTSGSTGFRLWYMRDVAPLSYAATTANGTTTTITLNTSPIAGTFDRRQGCQGIFRGVPIYIYQGTGIGQYGIITSVNSSFVATCVAADSNDGAPFSTTPVSGATYYSIQPVFPPSFYDLLTYRAALMNTKYLGAQHAPFEEVARKEAEWLAWLSPSDKASTIPLVRGPQSGLGIGAGPAGFYSGYYTLGA